jgi:hypothetical protein
MKFDQTLPVPLQQLNQLFLDEAPDQIEFEPYFEFKSASANSSWIKAWTGNRSLEGNEYRFFGQDGSGGRVGIWLTDQRPILSQPIIFFGSEGQSGVVSVNFDDNLWLLAGGVGPMESITNPKNPSAPILAFAEFATRHAAQSKKTPTEVQTAAKNAFPNFAEEIRALCR